MSKDIILSGEYALSFDYEENKIPEHLNCLSESEECTPYDMKSIPQREYFEKLGRKESVNPQLNLSTDIKVNITITDFYGNKFGVEGLILGKELITSKTRFEPLSRVIDETVYKMKRYLLDKI
jgi:hypothetical protein